MPIGHRQPEIRILRCGEERDRPALPMPVTLPPGAQPESNRP
jgi:hypothetical protein